MSARYIKAARIAYSQGSGSDALRAVVSMMEEVLGTSHTQTTKYAAALREMQ